MNEKILQFKVQANTFDELWDRFHPNGETLLNKTEWRGKEPRSCGVVGVSMSPRPVNDKSPIIVDIKVVYRPKGCITYVGTTRYDGWTATRLSRSSDGSFLDEHGKPLIDGNPPAYTPIEVHHDIDFNAIDFGEFIEEVETPGVRKEAYQDVMKQITSSGRFGASINSAFVAAHRNRPNTKIILSNSPSGEGRGRFGTRIININNSTPYLELALLEKLTELMSSYIEGKVSIKTISNGETVYVGLSDSLVECTPNEHGLSSWFDVLNKYVPLNFLEELAKRLMAVYEVEISVVEDKGGFVLRRAASKEIE